MATPPHLSPKLVVGVGSLLLTVVATAATMRSPGYPDHRALRSGPSALLERLRRELHAGGRTSLAWIALAAWSVLVSVLHFGGIRYGIYTRLPWWDLLTHATGGAGVAAVLAMTFRASTLRSPAWIPAGVLAIGAGFEVYEFVFKTFWYRWSLSFYVTDTAIDLVVNSGGAAAVAAAVAAYRRLTGVTADAAGPTPEPAADADTEAAAADQD
jgi:hypothetical protein